MLQKLIELVLRRWPESTIHKSVQDMTTAWSHQQIAALRNKPLLLDDFIERLGSCVILNQNVQVYFSYVSFEFYFMVLYYLRCHDI
jgi:hypothetical protein